MAPPDTPILFHYTGSPYSARVLSYLRLRNIKYDECIQPPIKPRPDLESLHLNYRRIPVLAIGSHIYSDSRLIITALECLYPNSLLAPSSPAEASLRKVLETWVVDGGIFRDAVRAGPVWAPTSPFQNPAFVADREKLSGARISLDALAAVRPEALQNLRVVFDVLESGLLGDGREWLLGGPAPSLADVDVVWPFVWLLKTPGMKGGLPEESFSERAFPKVYAWVERFCAEEERMRKEGAKPQRLDGEAVRARVLGQQGQAQEMEVLADDPLGLARGDEVEVCAADYGSAWKDSGALVGLSIDEVVIRNDLGLYLHFPRWNFRIIKKMKKSMI